MFLPVIKTCVIIVAECLVVPFVAYMNPEKSLAESLGSGSGLSAVSELTETESNAKKRGVHESERKVAGGARTNQANSLR